MSGIALIGFLVSVFLAGLAIGLEIGRNME